MAPRAGRVDPDALAALEEERDFLLRSLRDLEDERDAGDIDEADYAQLKDDYTRRAAAAIRSIDHQQAELRSRPGMRWRQALVWLVGLALLGGVAGLLIARSAGTRSEGETITGGTRTSVVTRLNQARALLGEQDRWDDAIDLYDSVIEEQPSNTEALTYLGWLQYRRGEPADDALESLDQAIAIDGDYPDALVFKTIVLSDAGRYDEAGVALGALDLEMAPEGIRSLVIQRGLVGVVYGESVYAALEVEGSPTLVELGLSPEQALAAAGYLLGTDKSGRSVAALKLYEAVVEADSDNSAALSRQAMLLAFTLEPDLLDQAVVLVERAVVADPDDPEALLSRVTVFTLAEVSPEVVCDDAALLRSLDDLPDDFLVQLDALDLDCPA